MQPESDDDDDDDDDDHDDDDDDDDADDNVEKDDGDADDNVEKDDGKDDRVDVAEDEQGGSWCWPWWGQRGGLQVQGRRPRASYTCAARFARACTVEIHMDISQELLHADACRQKPHSKHTWICVKSHGTREIDR